MTRQESIYLAWLRARAALPDATPVERHTLAWFLARKPDAPAAPNPRLTPACERIARLLAVAPSLTPPLPRYEGNLAAAFPNATLGQKRALWASWAASGLDWHVWINL